MVLAMTAAPSQQPGCWGDDGWVQEGVLVVLTACLPQVGTMCVRALQRHTLVLSRAVFKEEGHSHAHIPTVRSATASEKPQRWPTRAPMWLAKVQVGYDLWSHVRLLDSAAPPIRHLS